MTANPGGTPALDSRHRRRVCAGELLLKIGLPLLGPLQIGLHLVPRGLCNSNSLVRVIDLLLQRFQLLLGICAVLGSLTTPVPIPA
jgi:hypothetical protein